MSSDFNDDAQPIIVGSAKNQEGRQSARHSNNTDMPNRSFSSYCNKWWYFVAVSFLIGSAGLIIISYLWETQHKDIQKFSVVFDAGSSHTQLYIYSWESSKVNGTAVVKQTAAFRSNDHGIQQFSNDPSKLTEALQPYLRFAELNIPADKIRDTPIYLGATSGMRLLHQSNDSTAEKILTVIRETFQKSSFKIQKPEQQVRIINGSEEGTFAWITVNYLSERLGLKHDSQMFHVINDLTVGALDLGGASTQITFVPETDTKIPSNFSLSFPLYGHNVKVYTHSFPCYGVNEIIRRYKANLVKNHLGNSSVINSPCWLKDSVHNDSASDLFMSPCTKDTRYLTQKEYQFVGTGNLQECQKNIESLFSYTKCSYQHCSFNNVFQPLLKNVTFLAFSAYYWTMKSLNLTQTTDTFTLENFTSVADSWCNKTWEEALLVPDLNNTIKKRLCAEAIYVKTLLSQGLQFTSDKWNLLHFNNSVSGSDLGWALGFMIYTSNSIASETAKDILSVTTYVLLGILFVIFIFLAIGFGVVAKNHRRQTSFYVPAPNYGSSDTV